jgi:hypothetical protein
MTAGYPCLATLLIVGLSGFQSVGALSSGDHRDPVTIYSHFSAWIMGYTSTAASLFALIFSIGILVDDAIVVIENRPSLERTATHPESDRGGGRGGQSTIVRNARSPWWRRYCRCCSSRG